MKIRIFWLMAFMWSSVYGPVEAATNGMTSGRRQPSCC